MTLKGKILKALNERLQAKDEENDLDPPPTFLLLLVERLAECAETLEFYGTKQNWQFYCSCCADGTTPLEKDHGKLADFVGERVEQMLEKE